MELHHFKQWYLHLDKSIPLEQLLDEDLLFLVDRMIQVLGKIVKFFFFFK